MELKNNRKKNENPGEKPTPQRHRILTIKTYIQNEKTK